MSIHDYTGKEIRFNEDGSVAHDLRIPLISLKETLAKQILDVANSLDDEGLHAEADALTNVMQRVAGADISTMKYDEALAYERETEEPRYLTEDELAAWNNPTAEMIANARGVSVAEAEVIRADIMSRSAFRDAPSEPPVGWQPRAERIHGGETWEEMLDKGADMLAESHQGPMPGETGKDMLSRGLGGHGFGTAPTAGQPDDVINPVSPVAQFHSDLKGAIGQDDEGQYDEHSQHPVGP